MKNETASKFDTAKATALIFPQKYVTGDLNVKFVEGMILVKITSHADMVWLIKYYQLAYFNHQSTNTNWLNERIPSMIAVFTDGNKPLINPDVKSWKPPKHGFTVELPWFSQNMSCNFAGTVGEDHYYEITIYGYDRRHDLGNEILSNLVYAQNKLSLHNIMHVFKEIDYEILLVLNKERLQKLTESVQQIANDVFPVVGEVNIPQLSENKNTSEESNVTVLEIRTALTSNTGGHLFSLLWLKSKDNFNGTTTNKLSFTVRYESLMDQKPFGALSQIRGIEAVNLFILKCSQLEREIASW